MVAEVEPKLGFGVITHICIIVQIQMNTYNWSSSQWARPPSWREPSSARGSSSRPTPSWPARAPGASPCSCGSWVQNCHVTSLVTCDVMSCVVMSRVVMSRVTSRHVMTGERPDRPGGCAVLGGAGHGVPPAGRHLHLHQGGARRPPGLRLHLHEVSSIHGSIHHTYFDQWLSRGCSCWIL